jgi:hypothetical protein
MGGGGWGIKIPKYIKLHRLYIYKLRDTIDYAPACKNEDSHLNCTHD